MTTQHLVCTPTSDEWKNMISRTTIMYEGAATGHPLQVMQLTVTYHYT